MSDRPTLQISILHTNDIHGRYNAFRVMPGSATSQTGDPGQELHEFERKGWVGGFPILVAAVERIRAERGRENVLLVDGGDTFSDDLLGNLTEGEAVIRLMNLAGYQFMALGNHDFDYGAERTRQLQEMADFPMRAANVLLKENGQPFLGDPTLVLNAGGAKVGFIALGYPNTAETASQKNIEELEFRGGVEVVNQYLPELRRRADLIVALSHLGTALDRQLAERVPGLDLIIGGHSHDAIEAERIGGVTIVQAVSDASTLGEALITLQDGQPVSVESRLHTLWHDQYQEHPAAARMLEELRAPFKEQLDEVIATAAAPISRNYRSESPFDHMVGEILCRHTGAEIAFLPGIGYGVTLLPGPITREQLYRLLPHPATVVSADLTGGQVLEILEQSATNQKPENPLEIVGGLVQTAGLRWIVDFTQPAGRRVREVEVRGAPLEEGRAYRAVTNSGIYRGLHRYHSFARGQNVEQRDEKLVDIVEAAFREMGTVAPLPPGSIRLVR